MRRVLPWLMVTLAPLGFFVVLQSVVLGWMGLPLQAALQAAPHWSDEVLYWHQAATFAQVGLEGGYYTFNEQPAAAAWSRFYSWGAFVPITYGLIARLLGWPLAGIVLVNLAFYGLAMALYAAWVRPKPAQILPAMILLTLFLPLQLSWGASMQETAHFALAIALAGGFVVLLRRTRASDALPLPRGLFLLMLGLIVLGSLWRPTWGIFSLPLFWLAWRPWRWDKAVLTAVLAIALTIGLALLQDSSAAPYPSYRALYLETNQLGGLAGVLAYVVHSLGLLVDVRYGQAVAQRLQIGGILMVMAWAWLSGARHRCWNDEALFHLFNLGGVSLLILALHQVTSGHDYRVLAPHLLLSAMIWVGLQHRALIYALSLSMILALPVTIEQFQLFASNASGQAQRAVARWREPLAQVMAYQPEANPWCNTLSVSGFYLRDFDGQTGLLLSVPPGLGISLLQGLDKPAVPRAAHLLLTEADAQHYNLADVPPLLTVPDGAIYANPLADCQAPSN
ncbi:MAG: hypothetical protein NZ750_11285 [Anaerolineae bacterium]|nr:hypothetical protein [Anaerolineae bacterium]MDW8172071.1 hypothetical protein [Anaerolineae bacterium]